jgi:hypothetical protein
MADKASVAQLLRTSFDKASEDEPFSIQLPIYTPPVVVTLAKVKDAASVDRALKGTDKIADEVSRNLEIAARTLALASTDSYVEVEGQRISLGKLGMELYASLWPDQAPQPSSDSEAIFALFTDPDGVTDTVALAQAAAAYTDWMMRGRVAAETEVLGN